MREIIRVENVSYSYPAAESLTPVLRGVSLSIREGEFVAIEGPSGSGKSTFFYILACLLRPDTGSVHIDGEDLHRLSPDALARLRNRKIGFIFQQFHLLPRATVLDNILLPTLYPAETAQITAEAADKARGLAVSLGLGHRLQHYPNQLSGGEQQRVAIARALMNDARYLLADEPTGNLDSQNAARIMDLLGDLNRQGKTIVLITHDREVAQQCKKRYRMRDGKFEDAPLPEGAPAPPTPEVESARAGRLSRSLRLFRMAGPLAIENLLRNRVRAVLTMFGVTVGTAALFSMITFGKFARDKILAGYADLGVNKVVLHGYHNDRQKAKEKTDVSFRYFDWERDIEPLKRIFPQVQLASPVLGSWDNTVSFGGQSITQDVGTRGVSAEYLEIEHRSIARGRGFTPYHIDGRNAVCIIGHEIVQKLFTETDPLGQILFVGGSSDTERAAFPCEIIGVLETMNSNQDWSHPNLDVLLPYTYFNHVYSGWASEIHSFSVQLEDGSDIESTAYGIKEFFKQKYGASGEFFVNSAGMLMAQMHKFIGLFSLMLAAVATITLSVGGMGINNMMLVSIAERLKEIGLRKAVGATDRSIRTQFLCESVFLCALAGLLGILAGFSLYELIIYVASKFVPKLTFEIVVDPLALCLSLFSIAVVGLASGIVPAWKAERLQVMEAMRSE